MQQFLTWLESYWWAALIGGSCLIEVVPIKINPLSWLLKWIGTRVNGDIIKRLDKLERNVDQNEIDRIRYEVLDFANSCRNKRKHTQDEFEHIISLNTKYKTLLKKHDIQNGVFEAEYAYIMELYAGCQKKNNFWNGGEKDEA